MNLQSNILKLAIASLTLFMSISSKASATNVHIEFPEGAKNSAAFVSVISPEIEAYQRHADHFFNSIGLGLRTSARQGLTIKFFLKHKNLLALRYGNEVAHAGGTLGFYNQAEKYIALVLTRDIAESKKVLHHEMLHFDLHRRLAASPAIWVDEGLAEWLGSDVQGLINPKGASFPASLRQTLRVAHDKQELKPLKALLQNDRDSFYGHGREISYAQSAALMAYLFATESPEVIKNFLGAGQNAGAWFEHNIAHDNLQQFEENFLRWVLQEV